MIRPWRSCERTASAQPRPISIVLTVPPGAGLADHHPAAGKTLIDGRATAYVCVGRICLPPVTAPEQLAELLTPAPSHPALTRKPWPARQADFGRRLPMARLPPVHPGCRRQTASALRLAIAPTPSSLAQRKQRRMP